MNARVVSGTMLLGLISGTPAYVSAGSRAAGWRAVGEGNSAWSTVDASPTVIPVRQLSPESHSVEWFEMRVVPWSGDAPSAERTYGSAWAALTGTTLLAEVLTAGGLPDWEDRQAVDGPASGGGLDVCHGTEVRVFDPMIAPCDVSQVDPTLTPHSNEMVLPAPRAVLLGGLGVVLIGWLRRRRSL